MARVRVTALLLESFIHSRKFHESLLKDITKIIHDNSIMNLFQAMTLNHTHWCYRVPSLWLWTIRDLCQSTRLGRYEISRTLWIKRRIVNGCIDGRHWFHTIIVVLQATRWITKAAGRFTSGWTMCLFMAPRRRSRARASRARKSSRVSWRINFRLCSSRRTTSWLWSSSAARRRLWRNESGKKPQVTGSSILAPVFGKSSAYQLISFNRPHQYFALSHSFRLENTSY